MGIKKYSLRKGKFIATMKWNVGLTALNAVSTSTAMFLIAYFREYWWLYTLDFAVNGMSTFLMMGSNRRFLKHYVCYICYHKQIEMEKQFKQQQILQKQSSIRHSQSRSLARASTPITIIDLTPHSRSLRIGPIATANTLFIPSNTNSTTNKNNNDNNKQESCSKAKQNKLDCKKAEKTEKLQATRIVSIKNNENNIVSNKKDTINTATNNKNNKTKEQIAQMRVVPKPTPGLEAVRSDSNLMENKNDEEEDIIMQRLGLKYLSGNSSGQSSLQFSDDKNSEYKIRVLSDEEETGVSNSNIFTSGSVSASTVVMAAAVCDVVTDVTGRNSGSGSGKNDEDASSNSNFSVKYESNSDIA